jgi:pimeloyl-ACP methyl ester carboxylesterase
MNDMDREATGGKSSSGSLLAFLGTAGLATGGGWLLYSATMIDHNLPLPLAVDAERHLFTSPLGGLLNYYVDDAADGRPLVLIHSVNAAASSYEMRPLFDHYRGTRPVYALDLPGFGFSERSDRRYSAKMYRAAVSDFLANIVGEAADVVALSLGSEFAAAAALEHPALFHSLVLISPTGLAAGEEASRSQKAGAADRGDALLQFFSVPLWSQGFFDLLATQRVIRYFLKKSFFGPVDEGLASYAYLTSHQPGARFAPLHFISGVLFTPDVRSTIYQELTLPAVVIYDQDAFTGFGGLPDLLLEHSNWSAVRITPTRGLPQWEQPEMTVRVLDNFWQGISQ